jgi:hypothetical protein
MNAIQIVLKKISIFIVFSLFGRHFYKSCFALFALVALALSFTVSAFAEQKFALIGTWEHTEKTVYLTITFNPNGTCYGKIGGVNSISQWRGTYQATGASSYILQVQTFRECSSGGACGSCPRRLGDSRFSNGCNSAQIWGIIPGEKTKHSPQMQGPDQFVAKTGATWCRVHCPAKPFC